MTQDLCHSELTFPGVPRANIAVCSTWKMQWVTVLPTTTDTGSNAIQRSQAVWLRANISDNLRPSMCQQRKMRATIEKHIGEWQEEAPWSQYVQREEGEVAHTCSHGGKNQKQAKDERMRNHSNLPLPLMGFAIWSQQILSSCRSLIPRIHVGRS